MTWAFRRVRGLPPDIPWVLAHIKAPSRDEAFRKLCSNLYTSPKESFPGEVASRDWEPE